MGTKYSKEELNEAFNKLPQALKDIFYSDDLTSPINTIGRKYNLHINQIGDLDSETGLVLLGLVHPTNFVTSLTKRLGVDRIVASQIASDINDQVFLRVRDLLKEVGLKPKEDVEEEDGGTPKIEEHPTRDALLRAIENPESLPKRPAYTKEDIPLMSIKNPYELTKPVLGKDVPIVAPVPNSAYEEDGVSEVFGGPASKEKPELQESTDILTQKMSGQFSIPKTESAVSHNEPAPTKRVDPYKEQV
jgi:hypothetical protein